MIRSILYATDLGIYSPVVMQHALGLASSFGADLSVVADCDKPAGARDERERGDEAQRVREVERQRLLDVPVRREQVPTEPGEGGGEHDPPRDRERATLRRGAAHPPRRPHEHDRGMAIVASTAKYSAP